ncbi:SDR family NAD(P)-dependent oxidoreductase [Bacillus solitudinis]|uniref:SDR family NAD(P)-dependent oxidoreductase n=1 Tax=Bacillus solitudinis TaxID=2014074 RepID=UPI000C23D92D|nr:SDR family NAD(P)-dependent oxidoreductase [Bacillus solitudinis]
MNKTILITGASRGLGLAFTERYLNEGYIVFAGIRKINENIERLKHSYQESLLPIIMDISDDHSVIHAAAEIKNYSGKLDIIINNAASRFPETNNNLEDVSLEVAIQSYNINTLGPLRVAKNFIPFVEKGQNKMFVNISSEAGSIETCKRDNEFDYCMSKSALNMQSVILQNYVKPQGIKVLAIHPGWMHTDMGGEKAPLAPSQSAESISKLIKTYQGDVDGPVFLDYQGNVFPW